MYIQFLLIVSCTLLVGVFLYWLYGTFIVPVQDLERRTLRTVLGVVTLGACWLWLAGTFL